MIMSTRQAIRRLNQCSSGITRPGAQRQTNSKSTMQSRNSSSTVSAASVGTRNISKVLLAGAGVMTTSIAIGLAHTKIAKAAVVEDNFQATIKHADGLYDENQLKEALNYLETFKECEDAEVQWRLARLCYKVGKYSTSSAEESKQLSIKGLQYAEKAVAIDPENFACHKWMGVLINYSSGFEGYKTKIQRSFEIKEYFEKAIALNSKDATCRHLLGQWCYGVADVPWYQRKFATVIFAAPPSSSFEEALEHFKTAEEIDPGFYPTNWLYIGKSLLQLGRVEEAGVWLRKISNSTSDIGDDIEAKKEATALLNRLGLPLQ